MQSCLNLRMKALIAFLKSSYNILVQAADLRDSIQRLDEGMKTSTIDYTIASVQETPIMDIYHYKEMVSDNFRKVDEA